MEVFGRGCGGARFPRAVTLTPCVQLCSKYPSSLTSKDADGKLVGNVGSVELLNSRVLSSQPFVSYDWSPDKEGLGVGACLDQTVRVFIVTKLHLY